MDNDKDLLLRIASLIKENNELQSQLNDLDKKNDELSRANEKYHHILSSLPEDIVPKNVIKRTDIKSIRFQMATVLFLDIQGLKKIANQVGSENVIDELDQIIFRFNKIAKKFNLEKIKTIGDAYMCAGGVPVKNHTNPIDVVLAALEMNEYLLELKKSYEERNLDFWDLRLGIHTGQVTANIHGKKKVSYDLKGDTVHIATRMAASSDFGRINISVMTYELIKEYFMCEYHGKIPVKYKGELDMYYLKRIKPAYSVDRKTGLMPNEIFNVKYALRKFNDLQEIILDKLEKELPEHLYYHNVKHTIDVINQAELIGYGEGVDDEAILLLKTAALFHDAGHTVGYDEHELKGTVIAQDILPKWGYSNKQIDRICEIIMATKLPPTPETLLEKIICDSDLDYLGRSDFIPVSNTLYKELKSQSKIGTLNDWNKLQVKFLSVHQFFTETGLRLREVNKQAQIERIKQLIEEDEE